MTLDTALRVRPLGSGDLADVVALDALLTQENKASYWDVVFARFLSEENSIGLAVVGETGLEGYLFGEVRALEFGSEACGWIFALGVRPDTTRRGRASALLDEARRRFAALGVRALRTMVLRNDVPFLSLFRSQGFVGGPFVQLELDMGADAARPDTKTTEDDA